MGKRVILTLLIVSLVLIQFTVFLPLWIAVFGQDYAITLRNISIAGGVLLISLFIATGVNPKMPYTKAIGYSLLGAVITTILLYIYAFWSFAETMQNY